MSYNYGWNLLCLASQDNVASKRTVLVRLLHWIVTKSGYSCVGLGTTGPYDHMVVGSENLPCGWNLTDGDCTLRYNRNRELFVLRTVPTDDTMLVNFMRCKDQAVYCTFLDVEQSIATTHEESTLDEMVPNVKTIVDKIKLQLITPFETNFGNHVATQTYFEVEPCTNQWPDHCGRGFPEDWEPAARPQLLNIGRSDLDPLSGIGHGGGMLFNPFAEGRRNIREPGQGLPRGGVPPGARFDPINPHGVLGGRVGPDPDHLPPPGYEDMFM